MTDATGNQDSTSFDWGSFLNSLTGSGGNAGLLATLIPALGLGYSYEQSQQDAETARNIADPWGPNRQQYADRLNQLYQDPSSVADLPGYQFSLDQGMQALDRRNAALGYTNSGNAQYDLLQFAQGLASQEYGSEEQRLAQLAGVTSSSPSAAANAWGLQRMGASEQLGGLASLLGGMFGGNGTGGGSGGGIPDWLRQLISGGGNSGGAGGTGSIPGLGSLGSLLQGGGGGGSAGMNIPPSALPQLIQMLQGSPGGGNFFLDANGNMLDYGGGANNQIPGGYNIPYYDPASGTFVDPSTGGVFGAQNPGAYYDPASGFYIDPATGQQINFDEWNQGGGLYDPSWFGGGSWGADDFDLGDLGGQYDGIWN